MATKIAKKINKFFVLYASEHIQNVDEDNDGLYVTVISESDEEQTYKVHCDESGLVPHATKCQCEGHANGYECKHMQAASLYYSRIYKSNVVKAEQKAAKQEQVVEVSPEVEQVAVELDIPAEEVAKIAVIAADYQQEIKPKHPECNLPEVIDISRRGTLGNAERSAALLMELPSRQKKQKTA